MCHKLSVQALHFLSGKRCLLIKRRRLKRRRRSLFKLIKTNYALHKHLRARTNALEMYGKRARIHEFSITLVRNQPSLISEINPHKIMRDPRIRNPHINWGDQCTKNCINILFFFILFVGGTPFKAKG